MTPPPDRPNAGPPPDSEKMRKEIRSELEKDIDAAVKDARNRVKPAAQGGQQGAPAARGTCWACGGSGGCRACNGAGCGYCKAGACGSCGGSGMT